MNKNNPLRHAAAASSRRKRTLKSALAWPLVALVPALPASAQVMRVEPAIGAEVTYSNNGNQAPSGREQADVAIEVRPELWLTYQTSRLSARGRLGVTGTTYIGGNRDDNLYPAIDLAATLQAIRDFFYIDAEVVASRQYINPFAPQSSSGDANAYASYVYRIAPYFQGELPRWGMRYLLRNDFVWTNASGSGAVDFNTGYEWRIRGELATTGEGERLGFVYQYERDYLKYEERPEFIVEVGRAIGIYRFSRELSVNLRAGYEWEIFPASEGQGPIYGAGFSWQPTPRTDLTAWWEERFFGDSWLVDLSHRAPFYAVSLGSSRLLNTGADSLFNVPRTSDVFRALDAILTTRVPDPIDRVRAIRELVAVTGLPTSLAQPVPIYSQRIDLQETHSVSAGLLGARNSLVADAYYTRREGITAEGDPLPPPLRLFTDETQKGASLTFSHRLTPTASVNATALWQRTEGSTEFVSNAESTQWTGRLQYNRQFRLRTTGYVGARYIAYRSNVFTDFNETSVFVGVYHRF